MIRFLSFEFSGDKFYQEKTMVPLGTTGLTLFRGVNYDAVTSEDPMHQPSNGTGKTRLGQILEGFIYGKTSRGNFKKMVLPSFVGTLEFEDTRTQLKWAFTYSVKEGWSVKKNDVEIENITHKGSDSQALLQSLIGITKDEWSYFVQIDGDSLRTLIKGKPAERRAYLEEFFSINNYYEDQLGEVKDELAAAEEDLSLVEQDRLRLTEVELSLETLSGSVWLRRQVEFLDEASSFFRQKRQALSAQLQGLRNKLATWDSYQKLLFQYQDFDVRKEEKLNEKEKASLERLKARLEAQEKLRVFIARKLNPHLSRQPKNLAQEPDFPEPTVELLLEKEKTLTAMREKLELKKETKALSDKLPQEPLNLTELEGLRTKLLESKAVLDHRLSIVKKTHGSKECPTCGQSLPVDLATESPKKLQDQLHVIGAEVSKNLSLIKEATEHEKLRSELKRLEAKLESYPVFGTKVGVAEAELLDLKAKMKAWKTYRDEAVKNQEWLSQKVTLEAEAKGLGYPDLLGEELSGEIKTLSGRVAERDKALRDAAELKRLTDLVAQFEPLLELQEAAKALDEELSELEHKIEQAAQLKGEYTSRLRQRLDLLAQRDHLRLKVSRLSELKSRVKVLDKVEQFYSPSGFKLYELKVRCRLLVERANYWSQLFFQEPYVWSLSDDLDDLNIFVRPSNQKAEEPYQLSLLSAGERNRAARVLLFAQLEMIPPSKKTNLLLLDEIEANLDEVGMKAFTDVAVPKLAETFPDRTIIIVSHLKSLKNSGFMDHVWLAERRERRTQLSLYPYYNRRLSI